MCHPRVSKQLSIVAHGKLVKSQTSTTDTSKIL